MTPVYLHGVGVATPGLESWSAGRPVLRGDIAFTPAPLAPFKTALLPRNEARRTGASVSLAFRVAEQACTGLDTSALTSVFASSTVDSEITARICVDLATPPRAVSPTQFHNSVHNAAAGYWSIATGSQQPASSLSAGADSFTLGLREAWAWLADGASSVLLVSYEAEGSGPLYAARPSLHATCALALVLSAQPRGALASLRNLTLAPAAPTPMMNAELETLRQLNPSGRGLPLLAALAQARLARVVLESSQGNLAIDIEPGA